MAVKTISFNQSTYYRQHSQLTRWLLEQYLFPGLKTQGQISGVSRGIKLPTGEGQVEEYITLKEVKELVLSWLEYNANLPEDKSRELAKVASYERFGTLAYGYYQVNIEDKVHLATSSRLERLETYQRSQSPTQVSDPRRFSSDDSIKLYNETYRKVYSYFQGNPATILARLFPSGVSAATDINQLQIAQVIIENLPNLVSSGSVGTSLEAQNIAVANELGKVIARSHPTLIGYLNYLGDENTQVALNQIITSISQKALAEDPGILSRLETSRIDAGKSLSRHLLNESELRNAIYQQLSFIANNGERISLTDSILRETIKSSLDMRTIPAVIQSLNIRNPEKELIANAILNSGLDLSLEYRQGEINLLANSRRLTRGEFNLLQRGINPFLVAQSPVDAAFVQQEQRLLAEYNSRSQNLGHPYLTLREAYQHELMLDQNDSVFLLQARTRLNRLGYYNSLSATDRVQIARTRLGRWIENTRSSASDIQHQLLTQTTDFTDTITGKKWLHQKIIAWNAFAQSYTIKIGTVNVPIFRLRSWLDYQLQQWRERTVLRAIELSSNWKGSFGSFLHRRLKDYELGGYSLRGGSSIFVRRAWSHLAYRASAGIVKNGTLFSFRTATRFFLKIGAKSLAKATYKLSLYVADTLMSLSGVLSVVGVALIVKDVLEFLAGAIKWGWNKLKELIPNTDALAAGVITLAATGWAMATGFIAGFFAPLVMGAIVPLGLMFAIAYGSIGYLQLMNSTLKLTSILDSGSGVLVDIVCTLTGSTAPSAASNPQLSAGKCVYRLLTQFHLNPLNKNNASGTNFAAFSKGLGNGAAADVAQQSAQSFGAFQCVGLDTVVSIMTGGSSDFHQNAKDMLANPPPGYRPVYGATSCSPGDLFVDTGGTWGHTGLFVAPAGAVIKCIDANSDGYGTVRDETTCNWPTSRIAGCLKKT